MSARLIDSHCHLADPHWAGGIEDVLLRSEMAGVDRWLQGGVGPEDWEIQRRLAKSRPGRVLPVFGLHPWWVMKSDSEMLRQGLLSLEAELDQGGAYGVGETGLDHFLRGSQVKEDLKLELQHEAFQSQVRIARKRSLPLVLHVVRAHGEALEVLEAGGRLPRGGIVHGFSGSLEVARRYLQLGLLISVGTGIVGPKGFETLKRAVVKIPGSELVIESDAPDAKDPSWEPARLKEVARALARLRGETPEEVIERSNQNLGRMLGLPS